jgi:DNA-binding MarR family transcriptional regulator
MIDPKHDSLGAWAKRFYFASHAIVDSVLREYDLGSTQWYVLYQLATAGPTMQRDLARMLQIDRATLSGVVAALVRKGHVDQLPHADDQRQRVLQLTESGGTLWASLPDPISLVRDVAFSDADSQAVDAAREVMREATERLIEYQTKGNTP